MTDLSKLIDLYIKMSGLYLNQNFKMQKKGDIVGVDFHIPLKMSIAIPLLGIDPRKLKTCSCRNFDMNDSSGTNPLIAPK